MKKLLTAFGMIIIGMLVLTGIKQYSKNRALDNKQLVAANVYRGELDTMDASYKVVIDEADRGKMYRQVHLSVIGDSFSRISGHDYESDGKWDEIFFCGQHPLVKAVNPQTLGCNSVVYSGLSWKFVPNPLDQGNIVPFSPEAVRFAIRELEAGMTQVHTKDHLIYRWRWDKEKNEGREIWPASS